VLLGTIMRKVICTLIQYRAFTPSNNVDPTRPDSTRISPLLNWSTLECVYPRYPDTDELIISEQDRYRVL
jgi:hypothetical protein